MAKKKRKTTPRAASGKTELVRDPAAGAAKKKRTPNPKPAAKPKDEGTIVLTKAQPQTLIAADRRDSLGAWFSLYLRIEVGAPADDEKPTHTFKAKKADLERFLAYFTEVSGADHIDGWVRSVSRGFLNHLLKSKSERTGKPFASTTVDRVLATLKHAAKWIHKQRGFPVGNPMDRIKDTTPKERPAWKGLKRIEVTRLRQAAEQLCQVQTRANQYPYRNFALLQVGLGSALRPSEILSLDLAQLDGQFLLNVCTKGNVVIPKHPLSRFATEALAEYIERERPEGPGLLFQSKAGNALTLGNYDRALKQIAAFANAKLRDAEQIDVHPHLLRHTTLRELTRDKGIEFAKKQSNHISDKHIWRYVQPDDDEMRDAMADY